MNELLELIKECSSIGKYEVNGTMPKSTAYDYLGIYGKKYIFLKKI